MVQSHNRAKVFISYSHQDTEWLSRLRIHLKPLELDHGIEIWDDTRIKPGSKWREEITQALATAKVAVLLVSADFLASDFITENELPPLLSAAEKEGAIILPVILSSSRFERTSSLAQFQAVNNPSKPLIGLTRSEQESALVKVCEAIEDSLNRSPEPFPVHGLNSETTRIDESKILKSGDTDKPLRKPSSPNEVRRPKLPKLHPAIWAAIITGVVVLVIGYWQFLYKPAHADGTIRYTGRVTDQTSQRAIRGAKISAEEQGVSKVSYTDSDGVFNLQLRSSGDAIRIRVEVEGYESFDRNVSLSRNIPEDVRLKPLNISPQPSPIAPSTDNVKRRNVVIEYFSKDVDGGKVTRALGELGFTVDIKRPINDSPTNAIWFGRLVDPEDARLVAFTLIRAGVQLKEIRYFKLDSPRSNSSIIQVGSDRLLRSAPSLTVSRVSSLTFASDK